MATPLFDEADFDLSDSPDASSGDVGAPEGDFWRSRIVGLESLDPALLEANPGNWRSHPKRQREAIGEAIGRVGFVDAIKFNIRTNRIIDGHERARQAAERGVPSVPVLLLDLSEEEERFVLATFDPLGALAETDAEAFEAIRSELDAEAPALERMLDDLAASAGIASVGDAGGAGDDFSGVEGDSIAEGETAPSGAPSGRKESAAISPSGVWRITLDVPDKAYREGGLGASIAALCQSFGLQFRATPKARRDRL